MYCAMAGTLSMMHTADCHGGPEPVGSLSRRLVLVWPQEPIKRETAISESPQTAVAMSERLGRYGFPGGHPFGPDRYGAFLRVFEQRALGPRVTLLDPPAASPAELQLFHSSAHVEFVRRSSEHGTGVLDGGDTPNYRGVYETAAAVVGASLRAAEWIMAGTRRRAFVP